MYRLLVNLPNFSSCSRNFIKSFIKVFQTSVEYIWCEIISADDTASGEAVRSGPSPGFSSRGGQNPEGGAHFKIQYWMYVTTGGPNVKWGSGHHCPPACDGPVSDAKNLSGYI